MLVTRGLATLLMSAVLASCTAPPPPVVPVDARHGVPQGRLPSNVEPVRYRIALEIDPRLARFQGTAQIEVDLREPLSQLWLHGRNLDVESVYARSADDRRIAARYREIDASGVAELDFEAPLAAGKATLVFEYGAAYSDGAVNREGLAKLVRDGRAYIASTMYPVSARAVFPGFDEPRFKTPFELSITSPEGDVVISNAAEAGRERLAASRKLTRFAASAPLPTYLVALYVGPFDSRTWADIPPNEHRHRPVPLRAIAGKGKGERLGFALGSTASLLGEIERYLATPYPYSKLDLAAIPDGSDGGMENAAAISYGENSLLLDAASSAMVRRDVEYTHAHELAHQWFGDLVTPAWWDDAWINEAFATWLALRTLPLWSGSRDYDRVQQRWALAAMERDSRIDAQAVRTPIARTADIDAGLSSLMYDKGSAIVAMLEHLVTPEPFRQGVLDYLTRYSNRPVGTDDILQSLERATGSTGLARAFRTFLEQPGVPLLALDWHCKGGNLSVSYSQTRYVPLGARISSRGRWQLPVCFSYRAGSERRMFCRSLEREKGTVAVPLDSCPDRLMPNADGAGYYRFALPPAKMRALLEHLGELPAAEALALEDSLAAGMHAGSIDAATYLGAVPRFAAHAAWDVATAPLPRLQFMIQHMLEGEQRAAAQRFAHALYDPLILRAGHSEPPAGISRDEAALIRQLLVPFFEAVASGTALRQPGESTDPQAAHPADLEQRERRKALVERHSRSARMFFSR